MSKRSDNVINSHQKPLLCQSLSNCNSVQDDDYMRSDLEIGNKGVASLIIQYCFYLIELSL